MSYVGSIYFYKIPQKISDNACILELPEDMGINNIFNVEDLLLYHELIELTLKIFSGM